MAINFNSERLSADDNQVFYFDQLDGDALLSPDELSSLISQHQGHELMHRYNRLRKYYVGQHKILNKPRKRQGKPDTRLVVNFAKELVDNEVGYFAGTPVKFDYVENGDSNEEIDKQINEFVNNNNLTDVVAELAKQVDIFGRSYLLMYHRLLDMYCKTTEELYLDLLNRCPDIQEYITLKEVDSFLQVTPETVSRIRRKLEK